MARYAIITMDKINHDIMQDAKTPIVLATEYIDLELPSGTLWAATNVGAESIVDEGLFLRHYEIEKNGIIIPTKNQFDELIENTTYKFMVKYNNCNVCGGLFIGKNGKELFFPACGYIDVDCDARFAQCKNFIGTYWSDFEVADLANTFLFGDDGTYISINNRYKYMFNVRQIINK